MKYKKTISGWNKILSSKFSFLILGLFLVGIVYSIYNELKQQKVINSEINNLVKQTQELENKNFQLAKNLKYFQKATFIEREAREKLNMARPGEHAVVIVDSKENNMNTKLNQGMANKKNYQLWFEYFLGVK